MKHLAATFPDAMSRAVGPPRPTCRNTQPPDAAVPTEAGWHDTHTTTIGAKA